jgi:hypothetical protein
VCQGASTTPARFRRAFGQALLVSLTDHNRSVGQMIHVSAGVTAAVITVFTDSVKFIQPIGH